MPHHAKLPRLSRAVLVSAAAFLWPGSGYASADAAAPEPAPAGQPAAIPTPAAIVRLMEKAALWQLSNPIGFDIHYRLPDDARNYVVRIGWGGVILRRDAWSAAAGRPSPRDEVPGAWREIARIERDDIAFCALPAAVQAAWLKETGLKPGAIARIQMLDGSTRGWEMAAFYHGLLALEAITEKSVYQDALRAMGEANAWQLGRRVYHADDHAAGYMYLAFYEEKKKPRIIAGVQSRFDWIMSHPSSQPVTILRGQERWTWCDALFMAAPVWARLARVTSQRAYLDFMDREWWATTAHLYVPDERLFFRDANYFDRREANGSKIFWSRGNGWVLAALARVLDEMPADYPTREKYIALYRDMAARIAALQPGDGLWRSSLLDPASCPGPEASGSAFFCYALAWGVNKGHLDRGTYAPVVFKTWNALAALVRPDGHLGYIQQPGGAPGAAGAESTAPYGVGAFLLAGVEVRNLAGARQNP